MPPLTHAVPRQPVPQGGSCSGGRGAAMDIGGWLRGLGLEEYEAAFRDNKIDDTVLPTLTAEDLKDLGVTIVGHRRKLLNATAALHASSATEPRTQGGQHGEAVFALPCGGLTAVCAFCRPSGLGAEARRPSAARDPRQPAQHVNP